MNRSDMCRTGEYRERGIWGLDGYQSQFVVDKEQYVVRVPSELEPVGVLTEPLSIVEKAIDEAVHLQKARLPDANATPNWLFDRRCLVAGLGPIGLLATLVLRLRGAQVFGLDIVDANTARPQWLEAVGGQYIDGRQLPLSKVNDALGSMELIFEATGVASVVFDLLDALTTDGVFVLAGIPDHDRLLQLDAPGLMRRLVLNNQVMVGSVNAARDHFQMAVADLTAARFRWGDHVAKLITHHSPYTDLATLSEHPADEIKSVIEWTMA
jgi:threonine dehydrogenase-like Zn-dependent dehydrogenase